ncbi:Uncharacterised protein [Bordetella pertussis]|nr:Uncharacterised protein [Bordetella pertussis]
MTDCPPRLISMISGKGPNDQDVRFSCASACATSESRAASCWKVAWACLPNSALSCARLRPAASIRPCSSTTLKFMNRCAGSVSSLKSPGAGRTCTWSHMSAINASTRPCWGSAWRSYQRS